jgi:hypothetical protein
MTASLVKVLLLVVAADLVGCSRPEAYVECRSAGPLLSSGMACTIEHRSGTRGLHACWTMTVTCANGTTGRGDGCGDVEPRGKSSTTMPFSAFHGSLDRCDQASGASVGSVALTER